MLRLLATSGVLVLALSTGAVAQTAPAASTAPSGAARAAFAQRAATMALRGAYHAIADAEARGATDYLDAAKNHYRNALARLQRNDRGAASEAMAATALAHAAVAAHPLPVPRDIPTPPALAAGGPPMMPRGPVAISGGPGPQMPGGTMRGGPQMRGGMHRGDMHRGGMHRGGFMHRGPRGIGGRFDATRLAADVKLANTAEAHDLAQKALDADIARTRAAFSGNAAEAMRQGRLASDLAMAVRALAFGLSTAP